ncbi:hypothetical protein BRADI_1g52704v3, partial [Brachypodium distachyon]
SWQWRRRKGGETAVEEKTRRNGSCGGKTATESRGNGTGGPAGDGRRPDLGRGLAEEERRDLGGRKAGGLDEEPLLVGTSAEENDWAAERRESGRNGRRRRRESAAAPEKRPIRAYLACRLQPVFSSRDAACRCRPTPVQGTKPVRFCSCGPRPMRENKHALWLSLSPCLLALLSLCLLALFSLYLPALLSRSLLSTTSLRIRRPRPRAWLEPPASTPKLPSPSPPFPTPAAGWPRRRQLDPASPVPSPLDGGAMAPAPPDPAALHRRPSHRRIRPPTAEQQPDPASPPPTASRALPVEMTRPPSWSLTAVEWPWSLVAVESRRGLGIRDSICDLGLGNVRAGRAISILLFSKNYISVGCVWCPPLMGYTSLRKKLVTGGPSITDSHFRPLLINVFVLLYVV